MVRIAAIHIRRLSVDALYPTQNNASLPGRGALKPSVAKISGIFLFICAFMPAIAQASSKLELLLGQQTWQSLQAELQVRLMGASDKTLKSNFYCLANGDFAVRSSPTDLHFLKHGLFSAKVPGQPDVIGKAADDKSVLLALHRLVFAGASELPQLTQVSVSGDALQLRWNDWPSSALMTATLDSNGRLSRLSAADASVVLDSFVYQVSGGKIYVSSWRQAYGKLQVGFSVGNALPLWTLYVLDAVALDGPIPPEVFQLP